MFYWQKVKSNTGTETISVFTDKLYVADSEHPNFDLIVSKAEANAPEGIEELFDLSAAVSRRFESVGDRVSIRNGVVYLDGDPYDGDIADTILTFYEADEEFEPLVLFMEKLLMNPNEHSRAHAYRWLANKSFALDSSGNVLAYKSVVKQPDGSYLSHSSGNAIVDDEEHRSGPVPQRLGSVVALPRSEVTFDPSIGCSYGLHAGTWEYASNFMWGGSTVLLVRIHPRDIVSVPTDARDQKMRVSKYRILNEVEREVEGYTLGTAETDDFDEEDWESWEEDEIPFYWEEDWEEEEVAVGEQYRPWESTTPPRPYTPPASLPSAPPLNPDPKPEPWYSTRRLFGN